MRKWRSRDNIMRSKTGYRQGQAPIDRKLNIGALGNLIRQDLSCDLRTSVEVTACRTLQNLGFSRLPPGILAFTLCINKFTIFKWWWWKETGEKKKKFAPFYDMFFRESLTPSKNRLTAILFQKSLICFGIWAQPSRTECCCSTACTTTTAQMHKCTNALGTW